VTRVNSFLTVGTERRTNVCIFCIALICIDSNVYHEANQRPRKVSKVAGQISSLRLPFPSWTQSSQPPSATLRLLRSVVS